VVPRAEKEARGIEMAEEKPVYEDEQFRIVRNLLTSDCYDMWIGKRQEDGTSRIHFYLPRGVLKDLAETNIGELERKLNLLSPEMTFALKEGRIDWMNLSLSLGQAVLEEERRYQEWERIQKAGKARG
jgi:hypothetical protein